MEAVGRRKDPDKDTPTTVGESTTTTQGDYAQYQARIAAMCSTPAFPGLPSTVPDELWLLIFSSLPLRELGRVSCVCISFKRIASDELVDPVRRFRRKREETRAKVWGDFYRKQKHQMAEKENTSKEKEKAV